MPFPLVSPSERPWRAPAEWWPRLAAATGGVEPPYGVISVEALAANAHDMLARAQGTPIRVASKSVRVRGVLDAVLALPGYRGILAYTLPEALWLAETHDDVVVGYPSVDRLAIAQLAADEQLASRVTLMVDSLAHLDLVDSIAPTSQRAEIRVCLELDSSYRNPVLGHVGVRRSPVYEVAEAASLAAAIVKRPGFRLVGMMGYEAQIAGVGNQGLSKVAIRAMQKASAAELRERRGAAVAEVRKIADLEFVNGGGTGSLESTHADDSVTEIAAGSGLFGPLLFDGYAHFQPAPAASFAMSVVRRPTAEIATVLGGGWIASGPPGQGRLPRPVWPEGLGYLPREEAGEVQSPVQGAAARDLKIGDRVFFRHVKAGELSEHLNEFLLVEGDRILDRIPTYRGEGKAFL
ncbi:amino acid deaminase/aldolase [Protaetiibacter mangrovi]|uniref:Amino acid deaminase/aldolase n=1 Tax=Protaetiibacter mangrovi TaxID=2970926 RepID=A0ABT1ZE02_9MICO|nr:amino acid deaminase/aldolase [Protaetiibacter mangrovi]MCS0498920.1 amino acid deaminase/aldolase [Protaetiibacter mangrovi]TPX03490.1 amino acid deaminase/aldolase [Schumannella luteola]